MQITKCDICGRKIKQKNTFAANYYARFEKRKKGDVGHYDLCKICGEEVEKHIKKMIEKKEEKGELKK